MNPEEMLHTLIKKLNRIVELDNTDANLLILLLDDFFENNFTDDPEMIEKNLKVFRNEVPLYSNTWMTKQDKKFIEDLLKLK